MPKRPENGEKFYAPFVAKPRLSKKERQEAFWAEDWEVTDDVSEFI